MCDPEIPLGGCLPSQRYEEMAYDPREGGKDLARDDHALADEFAAEPQG